MLMFLARYAHQNAIDLETKITTVKLVAWVKHIEQLLTEEQEKSKG